MWTGWDRSDVRSTGAAAAKKGNDWYFGMKAHVGVDADSGIVHSLDTPTAKLHSSQVSRPWPPEP